ncbi:hypothetical protein ACEUC3_18720 [Aeromonas bivalvium]|uniref:hypothetical protein n=1 Tax=Aeromonas bivalvium TaxID=440079 RepID=UPI0038D169F7
MHTDKRLRRTVTLLQNQAEESLLTAMVAAQLEHARKRDSSYSVENAMAEVGLDRDAFLRRVRQSGTRTFALDLQWIVERFADISAEAGSIDIEKVEVVQQQRLSSKTVLDEKLERIRDYIERPTSGVLACYADFLENPAAVDTKVIVLLGKIREGAVGIRRTIRIRKMPLIGWLLIDANPAILLLAAIAVFVGCYFFYAFAFAPPSNLSQIPTHISKDIAEAHRIWESTEASTWSKVSETASVLGVITTLAPIAIGAASLLLNPVRRLLLKSGWMVDTIESWQAHLESVGRRLQVNRSALIHIQEMKVASDNRTTNIGSIGPGAIVNIAEYMANVTNTVTQNVNGSTQPAEVKALVASLAAKIKEASTHIDPDKTKEMGSDLETLSKEMTQAKPRCKWYELSLSGLKEAAEAIGQVGKPILEVLEKLSPLLLGET